MINRECITEHTYTGFGYSIEEKEIEKDLFLLKKVRYLLAEHIHGCFSYWP